MSRHSNTSKAGVTRHRPADRITRLHMRAMHLATVKQTEGGK